MREHLMEELREISKNNEYEQEIYQEKRHKQSLKIENALKFLNNQRGSIILESKAATKIVKVLNEATENLIDSQNLRSQLNSLRNELALSLRENKKINVKLQKISSENEELKESNNLYSQGYSDLMVKVYSLWISLNLIILKV
jgi:hypothetical protein